MRTLLVISIGAGHPDQVTVQAIDALNQVDVFLVADKGPSSADLVALRTEICARHIRGSDYRVIQVPDPERDRSPSSYLDAVEEWHEARAAGYERIIAAETAPDGVVAFLVWGDPSLYDSTLRIVERIERRGTLAFDVSVVPGVSSVQVLAARHRLVLNGIGEPITITTGRRLQEAVDAGRDNIVVMLDGDLTCGTLAGDWDIYWGANLGTPDEALVAGRLGDVRADIEAVRAQVKQSRGWVMDTYLLRRR